MWRDHSGFDRFALERRWAGNHTHDERQYDNERQRRKRYRASYRDVTCPNVEARVARSAR